MPTREDDVIDDGLVDPMNLVSAKSNEKFFRERAERFEAALWRVTDCGDRPAVQIAAEALFFSLEINQLDEAEIEAALRTNPAVTSCSTARSPGCCC